jgi:hypothetical protein
MKDFIKLNYYEMLDVPVTANDFEIRQAYKETLSIYSEDSSVTYSLFSEDERKEILNSVELAFSTLIDRKARTDYNKLLLETGKIDEESLVKEENSKLVPIFGARDSGNPGIINRKVKEKMESEPVQNLVVDMLAKERISGNDLREIRESVGIDLRDVHEVTRISVAVLKYLEEDDVANLPRGSYIKNFLKIYAGFLRVDSEKIVEGYLKNINMIP